MEALAEYFCVIDGALTGAFIVPLTGVSMRVLQVNLWGIYKDIMAAFARAVTWAWMGAFAIGHVGRNL